MKLYYMTGSCSFAPHVVLRELGLPFTLVRFDKPSQTLEGGASLTPINDKGYVPVLELDSGERLTEAAVVVQYLADLKPELGLAPPAGTMARYHQQEWLNFIATEIHKPYWPIFHDGHEACVVDAREKLAHSFGWVEAKLGDKPFLMGEKFTVADAYLLTVINWMRPAGIDGKQWPRLSAYRSRLRERPSVLAALEAEGLLKR